MDFAFSVLYNTALPLLHVVICFALLSATFAEIWTLTVRW